mmetsp:Transcript_10895/g.17834  ORF Transcript_10895/g.17834 Transcript_10895/m.17834 type:complete len:147 (+) Transcript_10895:85-525(+)
MISDSNNSKASLSSLPLEVLIHFNGHFSVLFFLATVCLYIYKSVRYYYPGSILAWDLVSIFAYAIVEYTRLFLASKGNKTSKLIPLAVALFFTIPIIVLHAYYIELQLYVMRVDVALNSLGLFFAGLEFIIGFFVFISFFVANRRY